MREKNARYKGSLANRKSLSDARIANSARYTRNSSNRFDSAIFHFGKDMLSKMNGKSDPTTGNQYISTILSKMNCLANDIQIYCGHEYILANLCLSCI